MRPSVSLAFAVLLSAAPLAAPARPAAETVPQAVLISIAVAPNAAHDMPPALWRRIVTDYVGARQPVADETGMLPDRARCASAHAAYGVLATFDRAARLPGLAQDADRAYGVARFTIVNCITGETLPPKVVNLESDPISESARGDFEPDSARTWERSIKATLARAPLIKPFARVAIVSGATVFLERTMTLTVNQVLRAVNASDPDHPAYELVVISTSGKYIEAQIVGSAQPRVGDLIEPSPAK